MIITSPTDHVIADCVIPWKADEDDLSDPPLISDSEKDTLHGLYARGLHAEEQNLLPEARSLYQQALDRDPLAVLPLTRLGILELKAGEYERAAALLERASRITPMSGEIHYYRGLALRNLESRLSDAEDAFWQTRLDPHHFALGRYQLGEIAAARGDFDTALEHFVAVSESTALGTPAWTARVTVLRSIELYNEAAELADRILANDTLNLVAIFERALIAECRNESADEAWREFDTLIHDEPQTLIELATCYSGLGLPQTALKVLDRLINDRTPALIEYHRASLLEILGRTDDAIETRRRASSAPVSTVFPSRSEEITLLRDAVDSDSSDTTAPYFLGTLLYAVGRTDEGRAMWQEVARRGSNEASLHALLGWASWKHDSDRPQALFHYQRAAELRPDDYRVHLTIDQIHEELGTAPAKRLNLLFALPEIVRSSGRLPQRLVQLYTATGRWVEAERILSSHQFHPWEGERTMRGIYTDFCVARGESLMDDRRWKDAQDAFERALEYPINIGVGRPHRPVDSPFFYRAGLAASAAGDEESAQRHWQSGASEEHSGSAILPRLYTALCRRKLGDETALTAISEIRDAIAGNERRSANDDTALGIAEAALGNTESARAAFGEALKKQPLNLLAQRELRRLG